MGSSIMIDAANYSATETLRDGRTITIRAQRPEDLDGWRAALARTGAGTLYRRFLGAKRELSEKEVHYFLDIDFVEQVALVAVAEEDGRSTLIGGGRYFVVEPGKAEVAFALVDECQAKGIGSALLRHLAAIGREAGLRELVAEVLSDNLPMLKVFERSGLAMSTRREGPVVHVTLRYP
jgi:RimJ/RimL family protein N-acetyltransferase